MTKAASFLSRRQKGDHHGNIRQDTSHVLARRIGLLGNSASHWHREKHGQAMAQRSGSFETCNCNRKLRELGNRSSLQGRYESQAPKYRRCATPKKLAPFIARVEQALVADAGRIKRDRRTGKHLFIEIKANGYTGGHEGLTDFIREWRTRQAGLIGTGGLRQAFIPLLFALGEAFQFDWSIEPLSSVASSTGCMFHT